MSLESLINEKIQILRKMKTHLEKMGELAPEFEAKFRDAINKLDWEAFQHARKDMVRGNIRASLELLSLRQLRDKASSLFISYYGIMRKQELVEAIEDELDKIASAAPGSWLQADRGTVRPSSDDVVERLI